MPEMPSLLGAWRSFWAGQAWDDRHRRLASLPAFSSWHRDEIRRLVAHGDEVVIGAGEPLLAEDQIGYWFVLVVEGTLALSREGRRVGTLGPGGHAGEVAILGFGPQPATLAAATDARVFLMGRRELLSLVDSSRRLQRLLFPDVEPDAFRPFLRVLRRDGTAAWRRLPRPVRERAASPSGLRPPRPGRVVPANSGFARMAAAAFRSGETRSVMPGSSAASRALSTRAVLVVAAVVVAALATGAATFHPPVVVVSAAAPVDVTDDVTVGGEGRLPITGRFVLTAVDLEQPTLIGAAWARARGDRLLVLSGPGDDAAARGRSTFAYSQQTALEAAARTVGTDAHESAIRSRQLQGPSAALVYALVAADLLSTDDLARGRTVAATGTLDAEGRVGPVGFPEEKVAAARAAKAALFIVPSGQAWPEGGPDMRIVAVATLAEALDALRLSDGRG